MKINKTEFLIHNSELLDKIEVKEVFEQIYHSISIISWPEDSDSFTIYPGKHANGVVPIKKACMLQLSEYNWDLERRMELGSRLKPGKVDAVKEIIGTGNFAVEWETGNISSSHRALNKMSLGLMDGELIGGVLIVPSRLLYPYLTDRIGNFAELEPYFPLWRSLDVKRGLLGVIEIEHDYESFDVAPIKKGTDGRALR